MNHQEAIGLTEEIIKKHHYPGWLIEDPALLAALKIALPENDK